MASFRLFICGIERYRFKEPYDPRRSIHRRTLELRFLISAIHWKKLLNCKIAALWQRYGRPSNALTLKAFKWSLHRIINFDIKNCQQKRIDSRNFFQNFRRLVSSINLLILSDFREWPFLPSNVCNSWSWIMENWWKSFAFKISFPI